MSGLEIVLGIAALLIGLTGAWSPCGFSMVETIGPSGHSGGRPTTAAALTTFIPGALLGGVATFGALAWLGELVHGAGGRLAYGAAAAIAVAAAIAEARGVPIVPQIRRQLPEHWRHIMSMPLAAGLYGVLLGLGFTTFVLSFGVWALAGISFAVGDPTAGIVIGIAFGAGRAIPVLALAPICERPAGIRATEAMTQRPGLYLGARRGDAAALMATAVALTVAPAGAATNVIRDAADPTSAGTDLAFEKANGSSVLQRASGRRVDLPGTDPALGGPYVAVREGATIVLLNRRTLQELKRVTAPRADALAVSAKWLAYRTHGPRGDSLYVRRLSIQPEEPPPPVPPEPATGGVTSAAQAPIASAAQAPSGRIVVGRDRAVSQAASPGGLGRPSLDRGTLVFSRATRSGSSMLERNLANGRSRHLLFTRRWLLSAPSAIGGAGSATC